MSSVVSAISLQFHFCRQSCKLVQPFGKGSLLEPLSSSTSKHFLSRYT